MCDVHHIAFGIVNTNKNNMNSYFGDLARENLRCWKKRANELYPCHFDNYRSCFVEVMGKDRKPHVSDDV
jgi:hypothetical protein